MKTLFYILDPMCSWCYAFAPTFDKLKSSLPKAIHVRYVMGGLAPHSLEDMPESMQISLQNTWKQISLRVGTNFNFDFWKQCKPRRSTYLACQACIVAREQGKEYEMIEAIQFEYYQNASNPSNKDTLEEAAKEVGLDVQKFIHDLESEETIEEFKADLQKRRDLRINGFPSLVFQNDEKFFRIDIEFGDHKKILSQIYSYLS